MSFREKEDSFHKMNYKKDFRYKLLKIFSLIKSGQVWSKI